MNDKGFSIQLIDAEENYSKRFQHNVIPEHLFFFIVCVQFEIQWHRLPVAPAIWRHVTDVTQLLFELLLQLIKQWSPFVCVEPISFLRFLVLILVIKHCDRLCGLVVRILYYRSRGSGFDSRHYQIF
jgi:hypothetical protein